MYQKIKYRDISYNFVKIYYIWLLEVSSQQSSRTYPWQQLAENFPRYRERVTGIQLSFQKKQGLLLYT